MSLSRTFSKDKSHFEGLFQDKFHKSRTFSRQVSLSRTFSSSSSTFKICANSAVRDMFLFFFINLFLTHLAGKIISWYPPIDISSVIDNWVNEPGDSSGPTE